MSATVRETAEMISGMRPRLDPEVYVFCATDDTALVAQALGAFREAEGLSLILEREHAAALGFDVSLPMRRIVLQVPSALDGIGLTAAVASALAAAGIACNMVAALRHDHVFVPAQSAERALAILLELAT